MSRLLAFAFRVSLFLLLLVAVFDPADRVTHLKIPIFVVVWIFFLLGQWLSGRSLVQIRQLSPSLLFYVFVFAFVIPLYGLLVYFVRNGALNSFDGFSYLKSYLFLTLAIPIAATGIDFGKQLRVVLSMVSACVVAGAFVIYLYPELRVPVAIFGDEYGIVNLASRQYGQFEYSAAYFVVSPLIIIPLAYFSKQLVSRRTFKLLALLLLNCLGLAFSGTRNNLIAAFLTPLLVFIWYSRNKFLPIAAGIILLCPILVWGFSSGAIQAAFDTSEFSNHIKAQHLADYRQLLSSPSVFLFGSGLGSTFFSNGFGTYTSITELTYVELVRSYGIFVWFIIMALLLLPLKALTNSGRRESQAIFLGYFLYLYLCVLNPLLFSSTGMLFLCLVVSEYFKPLAQDRAFAAGVPS